MHTSFSTDIRSKNTLHQADPSPLLAVKCFDRKTLPFFKPNIGWQQRLEGKELTRHLNHPMLSDRTCKIRPNPQQRHHRSASNRSHTFIIASVLSKIARLASGSRALAVELVILSTMVASSTASHDNVTTPTISTASVFEGDRLNTNSGATRTTIASNADSPDSPVWQNVLWGCMVFACICIMARLVNKMTNIRNHIYIDQPGGIRMKLTAKTRV